MIFSLNFLIQIIRFESNLDFELLFFLSYLIKATETACRMIVARGWIRPIPHGEVSTCLIYTCKH